MNPYTGTDIMVWKIKKDDVMKTYVPPLVGCGPFVWETRVAGQYISLRAFDKFYQASSSTEGTGVGLNISKRIVEDLGGRIWMESEGEGKGVTVTVVLPKGGTT